MRASDSQSKHGYSQPQGAQDCAFYECGRNLNHCSRYQLCDRHRPSANQSLQYPEQIQRLPIERISKASANQRKGRCGRLAEGFCIRLYSEADLKAAMSLLIRNYANESGIGHSEDAFLKNRRYHQVSFLEAPESRAVNDGFKLLEELNAIDGKKQLTQAGRQMASLPVDPKLARMLVAANTGLSQ